MIDISNYFGSLSAMATLVVIISGYLNTHVLKTLSSTIKQIVSWAVAIALAFIGQMKGLGVVAEANTLWTIINGLAVGLVANGLFDVNLVQSILTFIGAKKKTV